MSRLQASTFPKTRFTGRLQHKDLDAAYKQLLLYREALENPPLLVVRDLDRFEIHTNFTGTAKPVAEPNSALSDRRG